MYFRLNGGLKSLLVTDSYMLELLLEWCYELFFLPILVYVIFKWICWWCCYDLLGERVPVIFDPVRKRVDSAELCCFLLNNPELVTPYCLHGGWEDVLFLNLALEFYSKIIFVRVNSKMSHFFRKTKRISPEYVKKSIMT